MSKMYFPRNDNEHSGISIDYIKSRKILDISGWYDTMVGIEGDRIPLADFLNGLGITLKDCEKALRGDRP